MTPEWRKTNKGWTAKFGHETFAIVRHGVAGRCWRLLEQGDHVEPLWDAESPEAAAGVAAGIARYSADLVAVRQRLVGRDITGEPGPLPNTMLFAEVSSGGGSLRMSVCEDGRGLIANASIVPVAWRARRILGEDAITPCSVWVHQDRRNQGLARLLYDTAERLFGLPMVPNQLNGNFGSLSDLALGFWENRARDRRVPGWNDLETAMRLAEADEARRVIEAESEYANAELGMGANAPAAFAVAVHRLTGWPIEAARVLDRDRVPGEIVDVWCTPDAETVFTATGPRSRKGWLRDRDVRWRYSGQLGSTVVPMTADALNGRVVAETIGAFAAQGADPVEAAEEAARNHDWDLGEALPIARDHILPRHLGEDWRPARALEDAGPSAEARMMALA